jgi:DNA-binding transcriptional ArsR family regulator
MSPTKKAQPKQTSDPSERPEACLSLVNRLRTVCDIPKLVMLMMLGEGERSVSDLTTAMDHASSSTASRHLALLRVADIVTERRDGQRVLYSLTDKGWALAQVIDSLMAATADRTR